MKFDKWWNSQPVSQALDTDRVRYLRDMCYRVWPAAKRDEHSEWADTTERVTVSDDRIFDQDVSKLTRGMLTFRARSLFPETGIEDLIKYSSETMAKLITVEENDRKHGCPPHYRVDDVCVDDEWKGSCSAMRW